MFLCSKNRKHGRKRLSCASSTTCTSQGRLESVKDSSFSRAPLYFYKNFSNFSFIWYEDKCVYEKTASLGSFKTFSKNYLICVFPYPLPTRLEFVLKFEKSLTFSVPLASNLFTNCKCKESFFSNPLLCYNRVLLNLHVESVQNKETGFKLFCVTNRGLTQRREPCAMGKRVQKGFLFTSLWCTMCQRIVDCCSFSAWRNTNLPCYFKCFRARRDEFHTRRISLFTVVFQGSRGLAARILRCENLRAQVDTRGTSTLICCCSTFCKRFHTFFYYPTAKDIKGVSFVNFGLRDLDIVNEPFRERAKA